MDTNVFQEFSDIAITEISPGFMSKIIHTPDNTVNFIEVKAGNAIRRHQHIHHQCSFVIEGQFELTVDGVTRIVDVNTFALIPSNVFHSGRAITDCKLIDVFSPVRQDFIYS